MRTGTIGQRIGYFRGQLGLTQEAFAKKIGVTKMSVSRYEKDLQDPSGTVLTRIVELGGNIEWLLTGKIEGKERLLCIYEDSAEYEAVKIIQRIPVVRMKMARDILRSLAEEDKEKRGGK